MSGNASFPARSTRLQGFGYQRCFSKVVVGLLVGLSVFSFASKVSFAATEKKSGIFSKLADFFTQNSSGDEKTPSGFLAKIVDFATQKKDDLSAQSSVTAPVTVSASRLPNIRIPFTDVPANVSYLSANTTVKDKEELHTMEPETYQDSLRDIEGAIFYDQVGNGLDETFSLRGFSEGSAVMTLLDGVKVNEVDGSDVTYPLINVNDLESIQVDRGSASPIFGSGAFAGVVHLTTRRPSPRPFSLFGNMEISSFSGIKFNQGFSGTIQDKLTPIGGKLTYYFNGGRDQAHGYRPNGQSRITSFNIKTSYELPDEQGRIYFGWKHAEDAIGNPGELTFQQYQDSANRTLKMIDHRDYHNSIVQIGIDKNFWDNRISSSIMSSWRMNRSHFFTTSATFPDYTYGYDPNTYRISSKSRASDLTWQLGYQDEWTKWLRNQSTIGMEYQNGTQYDLQQYAYQGIVQETLPRSTDRSANIPSVGLFWRESMTFFERVIGFVGMRHDAYRLKTMDALTPTDNVSSKWTNSSVTTGLTVKPLKWMDIFANYSQGFRIPTINEISPFSGTTSTGLNPEKTDNYEVGTRVRMLKNKVSTKVSYFLIDMKDEIIWDSTAVSTTSPWGKNVNMGKSRRYGIELRTDINPVQEFKCFGSYTWMDAYVRKGDPSGAIVEGRGLGLIPENRFTLGGTVKPFARFGEPLNGFSASVLGVFTGRQHPQGYESSTQADLNAAGGAGQFIKPYSVWDFLLSYKWRGYEIYFKVNNLFDEKYYSRAVTATSWGTAIMPSGTYSFVNPGAPREFVGGMKWEL